MEKNYQRLREEEIEEDGLGFVSEGIRYRILSFNIVVQPRIPSPSFQIDRLEKFGDLRKGSLAAPRRLRLAT